MDYSYITATKLTGYRNDWMTLIIDLPIEGLINRQHNIQIMNVTG